MRVQTALDRAEHRNIESGPFNLSRRADLEEERLILDVDCAAVPRIDHDIQYFEWRSAQIG